MASTFSRDRREHEGSFLQSRLNPFCFTLVVDAAHHGLRIDTFLSSRFRNSAAARLQRLASAGLITVDDAPSPPDRRMLQGEEVKVFLAEPPEPLYPPESIPLEVLHEDPWIVALNKPAGLLMHPAGPVEQGTLANAAQAMLDQQTVLPGLLRPGIVHRLDRETSGVVLIAKSYEAHAGLTQEFDRAGIEKSYVALVAGRLDDNELTIDLPIGQREGSLMMTADSQAAAPRRATTSVRVLRRLRSSTLVEARPRTGRKHQIRVHLASIGHPILGDRDYSEPGHIHCKHSCGATSPPNSRHSLHAAAIAFRHPVLNFKLRVVARIPADFWQPLADCANC